MNIGHLQTPSHHSQHLKCRPHSFSLPASNHANQILSSYRGFLHAQCISRGKKNTVFLLCAFRKADPRMLEKMQSYISTWATLPGPFFIDFFIISSRPYHRTHSIRELDGAGWCSPSKEIRKSTLRNQKRNSRGLLCLVAGVW